MSAVHYPPRSSLSHTGRGGDNTSRTQAHPALTALGTARWRQSSPEQGSSGHPATQAPSSGEEAAPDDRK